MVGPLWETRLSGRAGIARALDVPMREQQVIVVRAFVKKTQKTPPEIALALARLKHVRP
jgi:phage-related protein